MTRWLPVLACAGGLLFGCSSTEAPPPPSAAAPPSGRVVMREDPTDVPIEGIDAQLSDRFARGDVLFDRPFRAAQGLGPVFVRASCAGCHEADARGPGVVEKMVVVGDDGRTPLPDQSALAHGPTVRPRTAGYEGPGVVAPAGVRVHVSLRFPPAVFARGLIDAVDPQEIERVEREQREARQVSGRVHRLPGGNIGRFGLRARIATLEEFVAEAAWLEMGLTSPARPIEAPSPATVDDAKPGVDLATGDVELLADYVRLLAMPTRRAAEPGAAALFASVGCASCHVPSLRTRADHEIPALAGIDAALYSDLLLHDLGEGLAEGPPEGDAGAREWRTAPLIGLRHGRGLLHDGRADTVLEAIRGHRSEGSEANASVASFEALTAGDRARLIAFVEGL